MAPISPSGTARLYLDYTVGGNPHSVIFRYGSNDGPAAAAPIFQAILEANDAAFGVNVQFIGARVAFTGTNVTNPLPFTPTGFVGTAIPGAQYPRYVSWVGRTSEGRRVRYYFYGMNLDGYLPPDYRLTGEEVPVVSSFQADLFDFIAETNVVAIDSNPAVMKNYANVGFNAYHQREARG